MTHDPYYISTVKDGKIITFEGKELCDMFLEAYVAKQQKNTLQNFVDWYNSKYDNGYESGVSVERIDEFLALTPPKQGEKNT